MQEEVKLPCKKNCKVTLPKCSDFTKIDVKISMKEKHSSIFVIKLLFFGAFASQESTDQVPKPLGWNLRLVGKRKILSERGECLRLANLPKAQKFFLRGGVLPCKNNFQGSFA